MEHKYPKCPFSFDCLYQAWSLVASLQFFFVSSSVTVHQRRPMSHVATNNELFAVNGENIVGLPPCQDGKKNA